MEAAEVVKPKLDRVGKTLQEGKYLYVCIIFPDERIHCNLDGISPDNVLGCRKELFLWQKSIHLGGSVKAARRGGEFLTARQNFRVCNKVETISVGVRAVSLVR